MPLKSPVKTVRPKKNLCVFQVFRPYLGFCPDPKHFIVNCEQNVVKFAEKSIEKCNFCIKYFVKIKCYADRPYLVFSELKPEIHIFFFWPKLKHSRSMHAYLKECEIYSFYAFMT